MKVYFTYCKDGDGDKVVDKVFLSSKKACKHIIKEKFQRKDYYKKFTEVELMEQALPYIFEFEVE
jgi:hypothetical protein